MFALYSNVSLKLKDKQMLFSEVYPCVIFFSIFFFSNFLLFEQLFNILRTESHIT